MVSRVSLALLLLGCSSQPADPGTDGGPPVACEPSGTPDALRCPSGCVSVEARRVDIGAFCTTSETITVACYSEDAMAMGDGAIQCFRHADDDTVAVFAPSTTIQVAGVSDDLLVDTGWQRCSEYDSAAFSAECSP